MQNKVVCVPDSPARPASRDGSPTPAVQAENLRRRFGDLEALAGVSVEIRRGEFFSLLGPSGCGKTTLLRIIAGLEQPDGGRLLLGGRDAAEMSAHQRPVNTVFQSYALFPHLRVRDNVAFGLRMKRVPAAEITGRVARIMELTQITPFADRLPAQLSGGQKQRVALARALVNEPDVLLLDEPLGALDLKLRQELQIELRQLQRRLGITFIFVTHDQEEALVMSDRIAVMNAGKIAQMDTVEALYEQPRTRFVAQFLGSCNLLPGRVERVTVGDIGRDLEVMTELGKLQVAAAANGRMLAVGDSITLAIRPEKIGLLAATEAPGPNQIEARVEQFNYGGPVSHYRVRVGGESLSVRVHNSGETSRVGQVDAAVRVEFPPAALLVLED